jgi:peptidoglycan hydrolase-like protein with peptidoglycan-binding domain
MKRITDNLLKRIVRQSLNENYRLLNEQEEVDPYDYTTKSNIGTVPSGVTVKGMTYPECPEGGFCYSSVAQVKQDVNQKSTKDMISEYCGRIWMGKPTKTGSALSDVTAELFNQLDDTAMDYDVIMDRLKKLGDFPTFCEADLQYRRIEDRGLGMVGTSEKYSAVHWNGGGDYGFENEDDDQKSYYYGVVRDLINNSLSTTEQSYPIWKKQLEEKYKIIKDAEDKAAQDKVKSDADAADAASKIGGGGAGWEGQDWILNHPALGTMQTIDTTEGVASVYTLNTSNKLVDKWLYGILVKKDGTIQHVKFLKTDIKTPYPIDGETDQWVKYAISKTDTWRYDDVIENDTTGIALTTDPKLTVQTESYRRKGFRHNLLTEIELKYDKDKPQRGVEVGNIQSKLGLRPEKNPTFGTQTLDAVINFQKTEGAKLNPPLRVDGVVDDATYNAIINYQPAFELSVAKKSKGDDVKLIQQKLNIGVDGTYSTGTEAAVKAFQEKYADVLPNVTPGVVDQDTFDFITKSQGGSGVKAPYKAKDWIYLIPKKGEEGNLLADKKYYQIKSVSDDGYTIVLEFVNNDAIDVKVSRVGGMTAKVLFGRDAEGETQAPPNLNDTGTTTNDGGSGSGSRNNSGNGSRSGNRSGGGNVDPERQRQRNLRLKEMCDPLREVKQYLNNTKDAGLTVNCKRDQNTINQIMMALTGGSPAPAPTQDSSVNTQSIPVTDKLF